MPDQTAAYTPAPVTQRDGSSLANSNCRMASIAVGIDYHTRGGATSTGAKMRSYTTDQSGGTDSGDAKQSWRTGYSQDLTVRDGQTFDGVLADLRAGRLVHLDVWAATVGGVCLSGSGAYGHTIAVLPSSQGGSWRVADPWCSPAKWAWVAESSLRAGAEEWGRRVYLQATSGRGRSGPVGPVDPAALAAAARLLMEAFHAGGPEDPTPSPRATKGPQSCLFTVTKAIPLVQEVVMGYPIRYPGNGRYGVVTVKPGAEVFRLADGVKAKAGSTGSSGWGASAMHDVPGGSAGFAYTSGSSGVTYWVRSKDATMAEGG